MVLISRSLETETNEKGQTDYLSAGSVVGKVDVLVPSHRKRNAPIRLPGDAELYVQELWTGASMATPPIIPRS